MPISFFSGLNGRKLGRIRWSILRKPFRAYAQGSGADSDAAAVAEGFEVGLASDGLEAAITVLKKVAKRVATPKFVSVSSDVVTGIDQLVANLVQRKPI